MDACTAKPYGVLEVKNVLVNPYPANEENMVSS